MANNKFYDSIIGILQDYHGGMTTMEVALKHNIPRDDVCLLIEKEMNGELRNIIFYNCPEFISP